MYFLRFLKGSIKIYLPKKKYDNTETITGQFTIKAKKEIVCNSLKVSLVGVINRPSSYGYNTYDVAKTSVLIEKDKIYKKNFKHRFNFSLPANPVFENYILEDSSVFPSKPEKKIILFSKGKLFRIANVYKEINWSVEVNLLTNGIHLDDYKKIELTFSDTNIVDKKFLKYIQESII